MVDFDRHTYEVLKRHPLSKLEIRELRAAEGTAKKIALQTKFTRNRIGGKFSELIRVLGYNDIGKFHLEEIERIGDVRWLMADYPIRRLWLWSRGFFKTSLVTVGHSIYLILNNVNIRLLLCSNTLDVSKKMLGEIRSHFTSNELFRYYFDSYCPKASESGKVEWGTSEYFSVPNRTKVYKEPTMMVVGIGTNLTGLHFDYMKLDDLVTKDSVSNDTQIQASKDYYSYLRPLFDKVKVPREDVVGSIYHFNDLYNDLKKNQEFEKSIIPVKIDGKCVFPERVDEEAIDKLVADPTIGPYVVSSQYFLNPINPMDVKFKEEWLSWYDVVPEGCAEIILVDPASTQKKKSDYTVIEHFGIDSDGKFYLINGCRDKLTVYQRIDKIVEFAKSAKRLFAVKYEVLGGRHGDLEVLRLRFMTEKFHIIPQETKSTTASKKDRIEQRLVGQFHSGCILTPRNLPYRSLYDGKIKDFVQEFKLEYLQFPFSEHDDVLDCMSQLVEDANQLVKGVVVKRAEKQEKTAQYWDDYYAMIDREGRSNPFLTREQAIMRIKNRQWNRLLRV